MRKLLMAVYVCLSVSALGGCGSKSSAGLQAASNVPKRIDMLVASTRQGEELRYAFDQISVPPGHQEGTIEVPTFGAPHPSKHFVVAQDLPIDSEDWASQLATRMSGRVGAQRDVLVYVHGFNTSLDEARFRLAQVVMDSQFAGMPVLLTWPSKSALLSYVSDKERAMASRDSFADVISDLSHAPNIGRIHILAHSMGAWLAMEALRQQAIAGHPDLDGHLGDVILAAPDIDLAVFKQQMAKLQGRARVSIFVSKSDRALALSARIAGEKPRLGAMDPGNNEQRAELQALGVRVYDLSSYSGGGFIGHDLYADLPIALQTIGSQLALGSSPGVTANMPTGASVQ